MASVKHLRVVLGVLACASCGNLKDFSGDVPPLTTITVEVTGDPAAVQPAGQTDAIDLHVALVWGEQWLTEPLCILPPETGSATQVLADGCRDPFGFVPLEVDADTAVTVGTPATLPLFTLPDASLLVGDLTARVGYASLVVYDDRDGNGVLTLARANRLGNGSGGPPMMDPTPVRLSDTVYGASFVTMTAPDQRLAYREGAFVQTAFYPRAGCGDPLPAFSVDAAGGFTADAAIAATLAGTLPPEDPATCSETSTAATTIQIAVTPPAEVVEIACTENNADSSVRYREPQTDAPDFTNRELACVHVPAFGLGGSGSGSGSGSDDDEIELIVTGVVDGSDADSCKGLTHYILKGCRTGPDCGSPDWDHSEAPPSWWPC